MQDTADGEFAVVKNALYHHLLRSFSSAEDYSEPLSSQQIVQFGNAHLGTPNVTSKLSLRVFSNLLPETVISRKEEDKDDPADGKTLPGISNVFEIICQVKLIWQKHLTFVIWHWYAITWHLTFGIWHLTWLKVLTAVALMHLILFWYLITLTDWLTDRTL